MDTSKQDRKEAILDYQKLMVLITLLFLIMSR